MSNRKQITWPTKLWSKSCYTISFFGYLLIFLLPWDSKIWHGHFKSLLGGTFHIQSPNLPGGGPLKLVNVGLRTKHKYLSSTSIYQICSMFSSSFHFLHALLIYSDWLFLLWRGEIMYADLLLKCIIDQWRVLWIILFLTLTRNIPIFWSAWNMNI